MVVLVNVSRRPEAAGGRLRSVDGTQKADYCNKNSCSCNIMYIVSRIDNISILILIFGGGFGKRVPEAGGRRGTFTVRRWYTKS